MSLAVHHSNRKTFAIISHPDAGKTTATEKMLLLGNAIQLAGTVKAKKTGRQTTSDWMALERKRGISVTTSVMQFQYADSVLNLLDTPGHADFSEDTYRTLTAVDSVVMVVDGARGVEPRTRKLVEVCRMRDTPIVSLVNKFDRESLDPIEMLDHLEQELNIRCAPMVWPIGSGRTFRGLYRFYSDEIVVYEPGGASRRKEYEIISGLESPEAKFWFGMDFDEFIETIELVKTASHTFDQDAYLSGKLTPVFFGSALQNFGISELLDTFVTIAPSPLPRETEHSFVHPDNTDFSGFVFKIQANMNPKHRDRIAFLRICSGAYTRGMKMHHVRINRDVKVTDAVTFLAGDRALVEEAVAGDIIGLHNHGTIRIGDTFTEGTEMNFKGIPNFAPELFKKVRVRSPLHSKRLKTGIFQLSEEGVTQVFSPLDNQDLIVGAVGELQFDVVVFRLEEEYGALCTYERCDIYTVRWVTASDPKKLAEFSSRVRSQLARDGGNHLAFLATSRPNLQIVQDKWPDITFSTMREHAEIGSS